MKCGLETPILGAGDAREQDVKRIRGEGSHIDCKLPGRERRGESDSTTRKSWS